LGTPASKYRIQQVSGGISLLHSLRAFAQLAGPLTKLFAGIVLAGALSELGLPLEVQQKLMRHASIDMTTKYGRNSMLNLTRPANAQIVEKA
jgi:hypothetical protein